MFFEGSLQDLCLKTIVHNFERFFSAYTNCNNDDLKMEFNFLQRNYSEEIADKLCEESGIEEKYFPFVINKYLTSLEAKYFKKCSWKAVIKIMAEVGSEIKDICIDNEKRPWHEIFCYLPNVEKIEYYNVYYLNEVLRNTAEYCRNIRVIQLYKAGPTTDEGWKSLSEIKDEKVPCSQLKSILIQKYSKNDISDDIAKCLLKNLPFLEVLQHNDVPGLLYAMHHKDLPTIDKVKPYKLSHLNIGNLATSKHPNYNDLLKVCFSLCPNLETVAFIVKNPKQLNFIYGLSNNLENLLIDNHHNDILDVNDILERKGSKLKTLKLSKCLLSLTTLAKYCLYLHRLHLVKVNVKCDETSIPPLNNLVNLTIENSESRNNDENLKSSCLILSSMPKQLQILTFINCDLTSDEIKDAILKCLEENVVDSLALGSCVIERDLALNIICTCYLSFFTYDSYCTLDSDDIEEIHSHAEMLPFHICIHFKKELKSKFNDFDGYS